jgi:hypothetical protein
LHPKPENLEILNHFLIGLEQMKKLASSIISAPLRSVNETYYILGEQIADSNAIFKYLKDL